MIKIKNSQLARTCSPCVTRINRAIILVLQTMHGIGIPRKQEIKIKN